MTIGIVGAGQLGRMLGEAALRLDVELRMIDASASPRTTPFQHRLTGSIENQQDFERFVDGLDAVTFETENIPLALLDKLAARVPLRPGRLAVATAQDRLLEKRFAHQLSISTPPWRSSSTPDELRSAFQVLGFPSVVKTRTLGFDGRGQEVVRQPEDVEDVVQRWGQQACIVEGWVTFRRELARAAVRGEDGAFGFYPLTETRQDAGMLVQAIAPVNNPALEARTEQVLRDVGTALKYVGVFAVEFFETERGLLFNEMAPRVHNSAHWTQDGARTCQFENHLRAVVGLPIGSTSLREPTLSLNLIGELPDLPALLRALPEARLHLYGKEPRAGRKLGHLNVPITHESVDEVLDKARPHLRQALS